MKKVIIGLLLCSLAIMMLSGCQANISIGTNDTLTGETYPNAEKYQTGAFTYTAADIKAVEIYWRSRKVEITESDNIEFYVKESSDKLLTDRSYDYKGDLYVFDEGASNIIVETSSGNLKIQ